MQDWAVGYPCFESLNHLVPVPSSIQLDRMKQFISLSLLLITGTAAYNLEDQVNTRSLLKYVNSPLSSKDSSGCHLTNLRKRSGSSGRRQVPGSGDVPLRAPSGGSGQGTTPRRAPTSSTADSPQQQQHQGIDSTRTLARQGHGQNHPPVQPDSQPMSAQASQHGTGASSHIDPTHHNLPPVRPRPRPQDSTMASHYTNGASGSHQSASIPGDPLSIRPPTSAFAYARYDLAWPHSPRSVDRIRGGSSNGNTNGFSPVSSASSASTESQPSSPR